MPSGPWSVCGKREVLIVSETTLCIDGRKIAARRGATILEAALAADVYIPHLCHHPDLEPVGACRLCLVELEGRGQVLACRTPAEDGMVVRSDSPAVDRARRITLELLVINHHGECLSCARTISASSNVPPHTSGWTRSA